MECVYKVAVIAEICECCCLGKIQRIVTVLTVAVPLGRTVWMLGRKLVPESAIYRGNAGHDAPLPHLQLDVTPFLLLLHARMTRECALVLVLETWLLVTPASEGTPG